MVEFEKEIFSFELVVDERDSKGLPTGKRKTMKTNSPGKLWNFYWKETGIYLAKRNSKKTTDANAQKILKNMYGEDNGNSGESA